MVYPEMIKELPQRIECATDSVEHSSGLANGLKRL